MTKNKDRPAESFSANGHKRALLVARVSTAKQEDNYSPETQFAAMKRYAAANGFTETREILDVCSGAIPIFDRDGGKKIYQALKARSTDAIIFYTIDRASRDEDVIDFILLKRELREAGIELHFADTGKSEHDSVTGIIEYIRVSEAGRERKKIVERTTRGKRAKAASGKWVGDGHPAYGYRREGAKKEARLVIDEQEAATVRRMFAMYTGAGGKQPLSLYEVARQLTREGVRPPLRGPKSAQSWHLETVRTILERRAYIGEFHYSGYTLQLPDLALIDCETWEAAQAQRKRNKANARRNRKREYLLSGHLRCICGASMAGYTRQRKHNEWRIYACIHRFLDRHIHTCRQFIPLELAERKVWKWLYDHLGEEELRRGLRRKREREAAEFQPKRERLAWVKKMIGETEKGIAGLAERVSKAEKEGQAKVANALEAQMRTDARSLEALTEERDRLTAELSQLELSPEDEAEIIRKAAKLRAGMADADFETRRYFLDRLDVQLKLKEGERLNVTCIFNPNESEAESIDLRSR
jgi:site-specific DNA recombinase